MLLGEKRLKKVVYLLEMEEEMEGRMVERMVEDVGDGGGEKWREVAGQGTWAAVFLLEEEGRNAKERKRQKGVWLYI